MNSIPGFRDWKNARDPGIPSCNIIAKHRRRLYVSDRGNHSTPLDSLATRVRCQGREENEDWGRKERAVKGRGGRKEGTKTVSTKTKTETVKMLS